MRQAVYLNRESGSLAIEVEDEWPEGMLSPELKSPWPQSEHAPKADLRRAHAFAKFTSFADGQ